MLLRTHALQAAMIDLDGTLIDTVGDFAAAINLMLADFGHAAVDRGFVERTVGKGGEYLIARTLEYIQNRPIVPANGTKLAIQNIALNNAYARYEHHYQAINGQASQVYPGVLLGLQRMQAAGLQLACLTNKPTAFAIPLLKAKGLYGYFSHVFGGDTFARKKPDPLPLLKTCEALGTQPAQTLMVGDSANDAQAADAAGCPLVLVTYGYNHGQDIRQQRALAHVGSLAELAF